MKLPDGRLYGYCTGEERPGPTVVESLGSLGPRCFEDSVEAFLVEETDTEPRAVTGLNAITTTALHVLLNPCPGDSTLLIPKEVIDIQNRALDSVCVVVKDPNGIETRLTRKDLAKNGLLHSNTAICCALPTSLRMHVMSKQDMLEIMSACLYLASGQLVIGLPDVAVDAEALESRGFKAVHIQPARRLGKTLAELNAIDALDYAKTMYKERPSVDPSKLNRAGRRALAKKKSKDLRRQK